MAGSTIQAKSKLQEAAWTATSSSATGTQLTENITLQPGVYVVEAHVPAASGDIKQIYLKNYNSDYRAIAGSYGSGVWLLRITTQTTIAAMAGAAAAVTYSVLERGGLKAVKIA